MTAAEKLFTIFFSIGSGIFLGSLEQSFAFGVISFMLSMCMCILMSLTRETL